MSKSKDSGAVRIVSPVAVLFVIAFLVVFLMRGGPRRSREVAKESQPRYISSTNPAINAKRLQETVEKLAKMGSRIPGYPGSAAAAAYVEQRLRDAGVEDVTVKEFPVVVPVDEGSTLSVAGVELTVPLLACWPNLSAVGMIQGGHLEAPIVYGGAGHLREFNGVSLDLWPQLKRLYSSAPALSLEEETREGEGAGEAPSVEAKATETVTEKSALQAHGPVVLLNSTCGTKWLDVAMLGASAVIFIEDRGCTRTEADAMFISVPLDIPRFIISREDLAKVMRASGLAAESSSTEEAIAEGLKLVSGREYRRVEVQIRSGLRWREATAHNIIGHIGGTDPVLSGEEVRIQAYFDSISSAPAAAPGADSASGIATFLELAEILREHPPARSVEFLATDAHFLALAGMRCYTAEYVVNRREEEKRVGVVVSEERASSGKLQISLDLSTHTRRVGLFHKAYFYDQKAAAGEERFTAEFAPLADEVNASAEKVLEAWEDDPVEFVNGVKPTKGYEWRTYLHEPVALDSEVWSLAGEPGVAFVSVRDARLRVGTPWDLPEYVDYDNLSLQARFVCSVITKMLDSSSLPSNSLSLRLRHFSDSFCQVVKDTLIRYIPSTPVEDALVICRLNQEKSLMGVRGDTQTYSDREGRFEVQGIPQWRRRQIWAFKVSSETGRIEQVSNARNWWERTIRGRPVERPTDWAKRPTDRRLGAFPCVPTTVFDTLDHVYYQSMKSARVLRASSDSEPDRFAMFVGVSSQQKAYSEPCAIVFTRSAGALAEDSCKLILSTGLTDKSMLLLGATPEHPTGTGLPREVGGTTVACTSYQAARDMWLLDEHRIVRQRDYGITNAIVDEYHNAAWAALKEARVELGKLNYDRFVDMSRAAWALEAKAYPDVRDTESDVVRGLIFYFALLLPFTFFAERLLVGHHDIRIRIASMTGMFMLFYTVLYFVHPAFQISKVPWMILDGFLILFLAMVVIWVLLAKFGSRMKAVRQKTKLAHSADVSRSGAWMISFALGIQNMRKRPMRTFLTGLTLVALMFTVLSFTSFTTQCRTNATPFGRKPLYPGMMARKMDWGPLEGFAALAIANHFRPVATVSVRRWLVSRDREREMVVPIVAPGAEVSYPAKALLGLSPTESAITNVADAVKEGRFFTPEEDSKPVCLLPERAAETLGVHLGSSVNILGKDFEVIGILGGGLVHNLRDLDGELLTPVDYIRTEERREQERKQQIGEKGNVLSAESLLQQYLHMSASSIVVLPERTAAELGAEPRSVAIRTKSPEALAPGVSLEDKVAALVVRRMTPASTEDGTRRKGRPFEVFTRSPEAVRELAGKVAGLPRIPGGLAERFDRVRKNPKKLLGLYYELMTEELVRTYVRRAKLVLFAGIGGETFLYSSFGSMGVSGMGNVILPAMIAGLMVLNVMMGAVYERLREIYIYASVGLAPLHIASLFLAESCVFASIGAIFGYLIGQVVAKLVVWGGWFEGISLNYSSTSAVFASFFVTAVVLASTLFPAKKAADYSVPDETRRIRLPRPDGDIWQFEFPFTVSSRDALGLNMFLYDFFEVNDEDSTGNFSAAEPGLKGLPDGRIVLTGRVWLMPLDMGVSQDVSFITEPTADEPSISRIMVRLERISGEVGAWERMNKGFFIAVRKQFLIWRLVESEEKKKFTEKAREMTGAAARV